MLLLWAASYLGCAAFLLTGLRTSGPISLALIAQLSWLALIGSVPTTLLLGAASRAASSDRTLVIVSAAAVAVLAAAVGWEHTDFLLSGPRWMLHPRRGLLRATLDVLFALLAAAGWLWLLAGMRVGAKRTLLAWAVSTVLAVALIGDAIVRLRAYDYSAARLVFPAGALCAALWYVLVRELPRRGLIVAVAASCALVGAGSRWSQTFVAIGEREVIAHNRAGALTSLYVLPHFSSEPVWAPSDGACPSIRPVVDESPIAMDPSRRRNVIIVTVDALRKDIVGATSGERRITPELTRHAAKGVSFENATSTYPATLYAVGSAFTGLTPAEIYLAPALPETIFTRAASHVDRQIAILPDVSWFRLPIVARFLAAGLDRTFAANDAAATDAALEHLRAARADRETVMAWIHYYAPHDPYRVRSAFPFGAGKKNAYLSEVATFDRELGRLLDYLREDGWLEDTLVVFFSDHGEALGEQGYWGHHVYLNGWMTDVPLVLWHDDLDPARPDVGASLADVAPTVLHFLGLPGPPDIAAQSLFTLDADLQDRPTFAEAFPVRGRELFDELLLPSLDDATIRERLRSIREASKGYEPKGSVTVDGYRLVHHRSADTMLLYARGWRGEETRAHDPGTETSLRAELARWEQEQLQRIECRLRLNVDPTEPPRPR